jgi:HAD superfamily hydrolase (TIGR01484 family)
MRYLALCTDYDGTLATDGRVLPKTLSALERLLASGRRLVLVTGRQLDELRQVCPRLDLFEYVVAENGALLFHPSTSKETLLAARPPDSFVATLRQRGVAPIAVGRAIVATWEPHETTVLETIRDLGLELQVIFNKGAVMILPAGVNKATGLSSALEKMELSPHNAVGIGDAENDHALLALCECSAAVANALPTLKAAADIVTTGDHGAGVVEIIEELLRDDLAAREPQLKRHQILLGTNAHGDKIHIAPLGETVLLVGAPHTGKSQLAAALMERLAEQSYTFCLIDVEGEHNTIGEAAPLGSPSRPPTTSEVVKLLEGADKSGVIDLSGLPTGHRIPFFQDLTRKLTQLQARLGHPHWLTIDETPHLLPANGTRVPIGNGNSVLHITERPGLLTREMLRATTLFIATGGQGSALLEEFCRETGRGLPTTKLASMSDAQALVWRPSDPDTAPFGVNITTPQNEATDTAASAAVMATAANVRAAKTTREGH